MGHNLPIRTGSAPTGNPDTYGDIAAIRGLLDATNAAAVRSAGTAYRTASRQVADIGDLVAHASNTLAGDWEDEAATAALKALRKLYNSANHLAATTARIGSTLEWYGGEILPWYVSHKPDTGLIKDGGDDDYAREYMARLNKRIAETWTRLPESVQTEPLGNYIEPFNPDVPTTAPGTGTGGPGAPSGSPRGSTPPAGSGEQPLSASWHGAGDTNPLPPQPSGAFTATPHPNVPATGAGDVTTDLASLNSASPNLNAGGQPAPLGGQPGAGGGGTPPGAVPPSGHPTHGRLPGPGLGRGPAMAGPAFGPGTPATSPHSRYGGTPLHGAPGAGRGGSDQDRRRQYWLGEDHETWDTFDAVQPVIGADGPTETPGDPDGPEVFDGGSEAWALEPTMNPVIGHIAEPDDSVNDDNSGSALPKGCSCKCDCEDNAHSQRASQPTEGARPARLESPADLRGE